MKKVKIFDQEIKYIIEDTGKQKLLCVHGFRSSLNTFVPLTNFSNRKYDVIAMSLPTHNEELRNNKYTVEYYARMVDEFIKKLKLKKIILVGHSLGGAIVINLAHKKYVEKIILIAPFNPFVIYSTKKRNY